MTITININDQNCQGLSEYAKDELKKEMENYSSEIIAESQRLESGQIKEEDIPDINRKMIKDAIVYLQRMPRKRKKNVFYIICTLVAPIFGFLVGILYKPSEFSNLIKLWSFIISFVLFIVSTIFAGVASISGGKNEE